MVKVCWTRRAPKFLVEICRIGFFLIILRLHFYTMCIFFLRNPSLEVDLEERITDIHDCIIQLNVRERLNQEFDTPSEGYKLY